MKGRAPADYPPPPVADEEVDYYIRAFYTMNRSRPHHWNGMPGALDIGVVREYLDLFGEPPDRELFVRIVFEMDEVYLPIMRRKQEMASKAKKGGGSRQAGVPRARR